MDLFSIFLVGRHAGDHRLRDLSPRRHGKNRCTRCDGTGQVAERWPDPKEPGGWHIVEGTCPKCKGKGVF